MRKIFLVGWRVISENKKKEKIQFFSINSIEWTKLGVWFRRLTNLRFKHTAFILYRILIFFKICHYFLDPLSIGNLVALLIVEKSEVESSSPAPFSQHRSDGRKLRKYLLPIIPIRNKQNLIHFFFSIQISNAYRFTTNFWLQWATLLTAW